MRRHATTALVAVAVLLAGCTKSADEPTTTVDLSASPQYVNRLIPGHRPLGLVSVGGNSGEFHLEGTASIEGVTVSFEPADVAAGGVAEVWVDLPEASEELPFQVEVQDPDRTSVATFAATLVPGTDDLAGTAEQVLGVFLERIGDDVAGLPESAIGLAGGTPVAGLLVVSHYAWFTDTYEITVAWHIMIAPDDFAELYLRPRDSLVPPLAYRINSWSTALAGGEYTFTEVDPPAEVTR
ncbi:MAG: hypothetical protein HY828_01010 [Actinobacteria bacterium]|nr:hypothetical protein [Actinomycetota bacterium]